MIVPYSCGDVSISRRTTYPQDLEVCHEVIRDDTYRLGDLLPRLREEVGRPLRVLDLGGHIGCFSAMVHAVDPEAEIHTYEMHPLNVALLRRNVGAFAAVTQACITPWPAQDFIIADAFPYGESGGAFIVYPECFDERTSYTPTPYEGETRTLDEITEQIGYVDLVKMDIEAQEGPILETTTHFDRFGHVVGEMHRATELVPILDALPHHDVDVTHIDGTEFGYFTICNRQKPLT
jgi:FkbM family methyltransferase